MSLRFIPPADVAVGDYEPKIKTECRRRQPEGRVRGQDRPRPHRLQNERPRASRVLVLLLVGLLVGIVVFGIKLTRR